MSAKPPTGKSAGKKSGLKSGSQSPHSPKAKKVSSGSSSPSSPRSPKSPKRPASPKRAASPRRTSSQIPTQTYQALPAARLCALHLQPFKYFSELRDELLCEECQVRMGASATRVMPLEDAYRLRLGALYSILNTHIYAKRQQLLDQRFQLQSRLAHLRQVKGVIDLDMKGEFSALNERLNSAYKAKEAMLQHLCVELKTDLDRITRITQTVDSLSSDAVSFLAKAQDITSECQSALSKTYAEDLPVEANDLPKELSEVRTICENSQPMQALCELKDEIIWRLKQRKTPSKQDASEDIQTEIVQWARLTDRLAQELSRLRMTCEVCGCALDATNVNGNCSRGKVRHIFVKQSKAPSISLSKLTTPPERDSTHALLQVLSQQIRAKDVDFEQLMRDRDNTASGNIKDADLYQLLVTRFAFTEAQAAQVVDRFDFEQSGVVSYGELLRELESKQSQVLGQKLRLVLDKLRSQDDSGSGVMKEKKFHKAILKAGVTPEDLQKVLKVATRPSDGVINYQETLLKCLNP